MPDERNRHRDHTLRGPSYRECPREAKPQAAEGLAGRGVAADRSGGSLWGDGNVLELGSHRTH